MQATTLHNEIRKTQWNTILTFSPKDLWANQAVSTQVSPDSTEGFNNEFVALQLDKFRVFDYLKDGNRARPSSRSSTFNLRMPLHQFLSRYELVLKDLPSQSGQQMMLWPREYLRINNFPQEVLLYLFEFLTLEDLLRGTQFFFQVFISIFFSFTSSFFVCCCNI
jgi:hypothetical protein